MTKKKPDDKCPHCRVKPGNPHKDGCDIERCPRCGHQQIGCNCIYVINDIDVDTMEEKHPRIFNNGPTAKMYKKWDAEWGSRRVPWTGLWPGVEECREYGWFAIFGPDMKPPRTGWHSVPAGTPGATENLNRLYMGECVWDQTKQRWVKRT